MKRPIQANGEGGVRCCALVCDARLQPTVERTSDAARSGVGGHILAALKRCPHCPFLAKWSEHAEGILYDDVFTEQTVDDWIKFEPWPCHQHMDGTACCGQKLFRAGALDVTRDELISIWVHEIPPGGAEPVADAIERESESGARSHTSVLPKQ